METSWQTVNNIAFTQLYKLIQVFKQFGLSLLEKKIIVDLLFSFILIFASASSAWLKILVRLSI